MKKLLLLCMVLAGLLVGALLPIEAQEKAEPKVFNLWPGAAPGAKGLEAKDIPTITVYVPEKANGTAIVICPGGGYGGLAMDHEGHQIAKWCNTMGVTGVILKYRVAPYRHPVPLQDVQRAIRFARQHGKNAKHHGFNPEKVGVLGFSAGGHLASTAATHFDLGKKDADDPIEQESCRPDFAVLLYPVITFKGPFAHMGSRFNLLGKDADDKLVDSLCNETQVTKDTPPTFLAHTTEDKGVPPENSVLFYTALNKAKVPAELHIFEKGQQGLGLGPKNLAFSNWPNLCQAWLQTRGFLPKGN